jgi:ABC-2 type transport system ATP-binding protein
LRLEGSLPPALEALRISPASSAESITLRVDDYAEVESMLAAIRVWGSRILEIELMQPDLEDVFLRLVAQEVKP